MRRRLVGGGHFSRLHHLFSGVEPTEGGMKEWETIEVCLFKGLWLSSRFISPIQSDSEVCMMNEMRARDSERAESKRSVCVCECVLMSEGKRKFAWSGITVERSQLAELFQCNSCFWSV